VAGGVAKTDAIRSVLRGRAVTAVVTDADVARRLLAQEPRLLAMKTPRRKRLRRRHRDLSRGARAGVSVDSPAVDDKIRQFIADAADLLY